MFLLQSTNTEENTDASEAGNLDQEVEYEENEDGSKLGRLFFTVFHKLFYQFQKQFLFKHLHFRFRWSTALRRRRWLWQSTSAQIFQPRTAPTRPGKEKLVMVSMLALNGGTNMWVVFGVLGLSVQIFQLRTAPTRQGGEAGHKIGCGLHCIGKLLCEFCTVCCVCSDFKKSF